MHTHTHGRLLDAIDALDLHTENLAAGHLAGPSNHRPALTAIELLTEAARYLDRIETPGPVIVPRSTIEVGHRPPNVYPLSPRHP